MFSLHSVHSCHRCECSSTSSAETHGPEVVRRIHPDLNHTHQRSDNVGSELSLLLDRAFSDRSFLALQLRVENLDRSLVVMQGPSGIVFTQLCEIEMCRGRWSRRRTRPFSILSTILSGLANWLLSQYYHVGLHGPIITILAG